MEIKKDIRVQRKSEKDVDRDKKERRTERLRETEKET